MSSEKQYKYIEDKIIEAATATDYAYNEAAWEKMEALLDKKKDKRRPFFWIFGTLLLGVLVLGGGIIYNTGYKNGQQKNTVKQIDYKGNDNQKQQLLNGADDLVTLQQPALPEKNADNTLTASAGDDAIKNKEPVAGTGNDRGKENASRPKIIKQSPVVSFNPVIMSNNNTTRLKNRHVQKYDPEDNYTAGNKNVFKDKAKYSVNITAPGLEIEKDNVNNRTDTGPESYHADTNKIITELPTASILNPETTIKPDTIVKKTNSLTKTGDKKDKQKKNISGFYILAAAGAESSSTKFLSFKNSSIVPAYGAGLGYRFNRRLSVQTGFYAGAKKYIAGPNDYKAKAGTYLSMVKIIKVDANCLVYDVPVSVQYNWLIKPKTNYYASVGISSYIMKKEKYNYTYVRYNTLYSYPYEYTKNSHLFASLQLSLGIEKQVGRKLFVQAAPTFNLPLQGAGEGSVKIFTTRLQVGLKYFPFKH